MPEAIITSLLDTDLYKFTMMQCVFHHVPQTNVAYRFICRKPVDLRPYASEIKQQIIQFCDLQLTEEELQYLSSLPYFKADFIEYLRYFRLHANHVQLEASPEFQLIIRGPWLQTILFEVPLLAIISEVYYKQQYPNANLTQGKQRLLNKIDLLKANAPTLPFSDFGTRRRFSKAWQQEVISTLKAQLPSQFIGTSNVYYAKMFNLTPIGTMAHEFLQAYQVISPTLRGCQKLALETWLKEYPHDLGIALTDALTMDIFLQEFDQNLAQRYRGLRQDSGDPFQWGEKALAYYQSLGINPADKVFVFSDSLTFPKMVQIYRYFKDRCRPVFGIGTNLTNDVGYSPLDIVIKMTQTNHRPVVKISDSQGKIVCDDPQYLEEIKTTFNIPI